MAHWHDFNPWASKLVYLPSLEEVYELTGQDYSSRTGKFDAYIIEGGGYFSVGIRYGKKPEDYLSPACDQRKAAVLFAKYEGLAE